MTFGIAIVVHGLIFIYSLLVIASVIMSYVLPPTNQIRLTVDQFVNPLLNPIRKILPPMGMFDFSPLVLLIILQIIDGLVNSIR